MLPVHRLKLAEVLMVLPGVPRHKAVWATPCVISCTGNHQGMRLDQVLIRDIMVIKMFGGLKIRMVSRVKVLRVISDISISVL
jgi:hypothetical protein